ncbi:MAG TPA: TetR/AcrR family transcriptional regulator C-terminal domain-containing protein [Ramlibacter sp.]|nr:TetR/AcrR family transcriptional regulator C-terminal domain-containing protein [Ramlibacter sp.]
MPKSVTKIASPTRGGGAGVAAQPADGALRKRGRPSRADAARSDGAPVLSREQILDKATQLAKVEPLGDISMVGLARELGVAPTLIHYYIGSRDDLISGVANRYFKERLARLQPLTGAWQEDLRREAMQSFSMGVEYGGVLRYMMSHNRFRLFQQVSEGETDYGMLYLDRLAGIFRAAGFSPRHAAIGYHLLSQFVMTSAYAEVSRQLPGFHARYIREHIESRTAQELPGAHYFAEAFTALDSATAFPEGLRLLIESFKPWLDERA